MSRRELREALAGIFERTDISRIVLLDLKVPTEEFPWELADPIPRWEGILTVLLRKYPARVSELVERAAAESPVDADRLRRIDVQALTRSHIPEQSPDEQLRMLRMQMVAANHPRELRRIYDRLDPDEWKDFSPEIRVDARELRRALERSMSFSMGGTTSFPHQGSPPDERYLAMPFGRLVAVWVGVAVVVALATLAVVRSCSNNDNRQNEVPIHDGRLSDATVTDAVEKPPVDSTARVITVTPHDADTRVDATPPIDPLVAKLLRGIRFPVGKCKRANVLRPTALNNNFVVHARCACPNGKQTDLAEIATFVDENHLPSSLSIERALSTLGETCSD